MEALTDKHLEPSGYRKKLGADYLLDGSVQHIGDQVRMKLSLTRTKDEAEVWSDQVGGKLDDVFAFQERVANEVEGLIRGRVAPGGGRRTENIATSGDVYALYAEARAKDRRRDSGSARQANDPTTARATTAAATRSRRRRGRACSSARPTGRSGGGGDSLTFAFRVSSVDRERFLPRALPRPDRLHGGERATDDARPIDGASSRQRSPVWSPASTRWPDAR